MSILSILEPQHFTRTSCLTSARAHLDAATDLLRLNDTSAASIANAHAATATAYIALAGTGDLDAHRQIIETHLETIAARHCQ